MSGTRAFSGRPADEVTLDAVRDGRIGPDDVRISAETLERQAQVAEQHANPQLAANFRRAAELVGVPGEELLRIYDRLRPHRSTAAELHELADSLDARGAHRNAAMIREAAGAYARRGLLA